MIFIYGNPMVCEYGHSAGFHGGTDEPMRCDICGGIAVHTAKDVIGFAATGCELIHDDRMVCFELSETDWEKLLAWGVPVQADVNIAKQVIS